MIESPTNRVEYNGDGLTDTFDYPFLIFQNSDLKVYVDGSLVNSSAYTVTGVGNPAGGSVILDDIPDSGQANVILEREALFTQPVSIAEGSKFPARVVEAAHDRNVMLSQQLDTRVTRCVQIGVTNFTAADNMVLEASASERATRVIAFNSTGTGLTLISGGGTAEAEIWAQAAENSAINSANSAQYSSDAFNAINAIVAGLQDQINAAISGFVTGDMKMTWRPSPTTGWVFMNDGTIGSGASGATTRANADTEDLYTLFWNTFDDELVPVTGGRGADAATDFAADKPLRLPRVLGRALYAAGTGTSVAVGGDGQVNTTNSTLTVRSNHDTWVTGMTVAFTLASGTVTGLTSGTTYYIIRDSATTVKLATSMLNAQNDIHINLTAKSSPVWTLTHTYSAREHGGFFGEQHHAQASWEIGPHAHSHSHSLPNIWRGTGGGNNPSGVGTSGLGGGSTGVNATPSGGGVRTRTAPPGIACNVVVKL